MTARLLRWETRVERHLHYAIFGILLLAFAITFYHLGVRTLHGDELNSVVEGQDLGLNLAAFSYFAFLHFWQLAGSSEFWLRSLSALFMVLAVAVSYGAARKLWGDRMALIVAALLATAPFAEVYAQQIRFYTLYLLAACISIWTFLLVLDSPTRRRVIAWLLGTAFLLTTHGMSLLLVASEALGLFLLRSKFTTRQKAVTLAALAVIGAILVVSPLKALAFDTVARWSNATSTYTGSRGLSLSQVAKPLQTVFLFMFGESVYPLNLALVIPGLVIFGLALADGVWQLRRRPDVLAFVAVAAFVGLGLLFLVFDALTPTTFQGATAQYVIFLLPVFYIVVGAAANRQGWLVPLLLVVNLLSLVSYWAGDWALSDDLVNWRTVTEQVGNYVTPQTLVLMDGRSQEIAKHYFPTAWNTQPMWNYASADSPALPDAPRIIFVTDDFHADPRAQATGLLDKIGSKYTQTGAWSKYPVFIYMFDRTGQENAAASVNIPKEIYGLEFQDVKLPISVEVAGQSYQVTGSFGLPTLSGQTAQVIPLSQPSTARGLMLLSDVTNAKGLKIGDQVATLKVTDVTGATVNVPIRLGYETSAWNASCQASACESVYTWRKRFAFLGEAGYAESWQEFNASIFAADLKLNPATRIQSVQVVRDNANGVLHIWGMRLEP